MGEVESRLDITIDAPWYRSWWAILCYILLIVALLFLRKPVLNWWNRWQENRSNRLLEEATSETDETPEEEEIEEAVLMDDEPQT